jgi:hypothetical protein
MRRGRRFPWSGSCGLRVSSGKRGLGRGRELPRYRRTRSAVRRHRATDSTFPALSTPAPGVTNGWRQRSVIGGIRPSTGAYWTFPPEHRCQPAYKSPRGISSATGCSTRLMTGAPAGTDSGKPTRATGKTSRLRLTPISNPSSRPIASTAPEPFAPGRRSSASTRIPSTTSRSAHMQTTSSRHRRRPSFSAASTRTSRKQTARKRAASSASYRAASPIAPAQRTNSIRPVYSSSRVCLPERDAGSVGSKRWSWTTAAS